MSISVQIQNNCLILLADNALLSEKDITSCSLAIEAHNVIPLVVFDFSQALIINQQAQLALAEVLKTLAAKNIKVQLLAHKDLADSFEKVGIDKLCPCFINMNGLSIRNRSNTETYDAAEVLQAVIDSVRHTLQGYAKTNFVNKPSYLRPVGSSRHADIVAVVGLIGRNFKGTFALSMAADVYLEIISRIMGCKFNQIEPGLEDWINELLNVSSAHTKNVLNRKGYELKFSLPTVIKGAELTSVEANGGPAIIVPFSSDIGEIYAELLMSDASGGA